MELTYEQYAELMDELVAEGYDVLEASEMIFNGQLDEAGNPGGVLAQQQRLQQSAQNYARTSSGGTLGAGGGQAAMRALQAKGVDPRSAYARVYTQGQKNIEQAGRQPAQSTGMYGRYAPPSMQQRTPAPTAPARPAAAPAVRPAASPAPVAARPAAAPASTPTRPAATPSAKVDTAPAAKPAGSPMQQWAAANPKLAAAAAERSRTRGTSATTNPQMADLKSRLPAPSSPSPSTASTGFKLAKQGVDLSKTNKQKINAGMEIQGDKLQEELKGDGYGGSARPDSLLDAYQSIYKS
jgi:hypothetical protein